MQPRQLMQSSPSAVHPRVHVNRSFRYPFHLLSTFHCALWVSVEPPPSCICGRIFYLNVFKLPTIREVILQAAILHGTPGRYTGTPSAMTICDIKSVGHTHTNLRASRHCGSGPALQEHIVCSPRFDLKPSLESSAVLILPPSSSPRPGLCMAGQASLTSLT